MNRLFLYSILSVFILAGCSTAQKATDVRANSISVAPYLKMDCKELATEQTSLVKEAEALGAKVDLEYQRDKRTEAVAWILFWPATFMMDGNADSAAQLASIKGQLEAVGDAMKVNTCVT